MATSHPVFVPNGENRRDTAILLTGTAEEFNIPQRSIKTTSTGFFITDELADIIYDGGEQDEAVVEETPAKPKKNASGNRAAKTTGTEKE